MKLADVPYQYNFYWKGERYVQVIRLKKPLKPSGVVCRPFSDPCGEWMDIPIESEVKPVVRALT